MKVLVPRLFWAKDPSPLTAIRDARGAATDAMKDRAEAVAKDLGGKAACGRDGMHGVVFQSKPDLSRWTLISHTLDTDQPVYKPKKNTKEGRKLASAIESVRTEYTREHEEEALRQLGLYAWLTVDRTFIRTTLGWAGDRVYVLVPWIVGADERDDETIHTVKDNLTIPDWLTECSEFEMREFFAKAGAA